MVPSVSEIEELVIKRHDFLDALDDSPATKPELVDRLNTSRSTVDRAIDDLGRCNFVSRPDDRYQLTMAGKAVHEQHQSHLDDLRSIQQALDVMAMLPPDVPFSFDLLEDARVQRAESHDPHQPLELAAETMSTATRIKTLSPAVFPICVEAIKQWANDGKTVELAVPGDVLNAMADRYRDELSSLEGPGHSLYELPTPPPYTLWIAETGEEKYTGLMPNSETGAQGLIVTDNDDARQWASEQYESYLEQATPVERLEGRA
jgi:predicted transcriptional regulator